MYGADHDKSDDAQNSSKAAAEETMQENGSMQTENSTTEKSVGEDDTTDSEKIVDEESSEESLTAEEETQEENTVSEENSADEKKQDEKNISESNEEDNVTNLVENPSSEEIGSTESVSETQETKVGWVQDGEEKYYYKEDGTPAEGFTEIDGKTYYFDSNGRMYKNTTFGSYDETDDFYKTYRVDNQGELVKGWYTDEYDNVYYYDSNGVQAQGLTEINGKTYYFNWNMYVDSMVKIDDMLYYFGQDGTMQAQHSISEDGWMEAEGEKYYIKNGDIVRGEFVTEGEYTYYFGYDGVMCKNQKINRYDSEAQEDKYYRVDEDGHLMKGWYTDEYNNIYYYDNNGVQVRGLTEIDGKTYYFDWNMYVDSMVKIDDMLYYFGQDGTMQAQHSTSEDGWMEVEGDKYYIKNGDIVRGEFVTEGEYTYYFDHNGVMCRNQEVYQYDYEAQKDKYYRVDEDGHLIKGWYTGEYNDTYYYDNNGVQARGLTEINGKTYYFNRNMYVDSMVEIDDMLYYFGQDGTMQAQHPLSEDGWMEMNGNQYYIKNGDIVRDEFVTEGEFTYYFDYRGVMRKDETVSKYDYEEQKNKYYRIDEDGHLIKGWYTDEYNNTYYFDNDGVRAEGITEINGKSYFFNSYGELYKNRIVYYYDSKTQKGMYYRVDEDGELIKGWYTDENDHIYYYDSNGVQADGLTEIDGKTYYFNGYMYINRRVIVDGTLYYLGQDGSVESQLKPSKDGWAKFGDDWYYVKNGEFVCDEFIEDGGYVYIISSDGTMVIGEYLYNDPETSGQKYYRTDEAGHLYKGWYQSKKQNEDYNEWYYYGEDGARVSGLTTINGKKYYFSDWMKKDYMWISQDGMFYYFGPDGELEIERSLSQEGWISAGGYWYYAKDNYLVRNQLLELGQYTYYMDHDGKMCTDKTFYIYNYSDGTSKNYRVDKEGHLVKGWYTDENNKIYYYDSNGVQAEGLTIIDEKTYYFDYSMRTNYGTTINGEFYYFGEDGVLSIKKKLDTDGWFKVGDNWYYARNQELVRNELLTIGQYTYYMNHDGTMYTDGEAWIYGSPFEEVKICRFDKEGHMVKGWYNNGNDWRYYNTDGTIATGLKTIDGKTYYFDYSMRTNYGTTIDGEFYYFGEDGVLSIQKKLDTDGWLAAGNNWYYVKDQDLVRGDFVKVGQYTYYMGYDGIMYTNTDLQIYDDETNRYKNYRVDEQGHLVTGWYTEYGNRYYYGTDGVQVKGLATINGKTYYFDSSMRTNLAVIVDGTFYYFGANGEGKIIKKIDQDEWVFVGNNWYYVKNKELLRTTVQQIGNYTYVFDDSGKMVINSTCRAFDNEGAWQYYRTDKEGHVITGWYYYDGDSWYYYEDGKAASGIANVNNVKYYFSESGQMWKNQTAAENGTLYYFGADGTIAQSVSLKTDGWKEMTTGWYYAKDGDIVRDQFMTIGNNKYYFLSDGKMARNDVSYAKTDDYNWKPYGFDENGHLIKGWYLAQQQSFGNHFINNTWYYFDNDGIALSGIQTINNIVYYFENGKMCVNAKKTKDGKLYVFGLDGMGKEYTQDGWINDKYYIENGNLVTGWKMISQKWYYFDKNSSEKVRSEKREIDGSMYYFDSEGEMLTGTLRNTNEGVIYADESGRLQKEGWYATADGKWYYLKNASAVTGAVKINGNYNIFRTDGTWIKALDSTQTGWLEDNGLYYYIEEGIPVIDDSRVINGATYLFSVNGVM